MSDAVYTPGPLNAPPDPRPGVVGVDVLTGTTIRFRFPSGESYTVTLPSGAPGVPGTNGVTPTFVVGKVTALPTGADATVVVRSTDQPNRYALDFQLPAGPVGATPGLIAGTFTTGAAGSSVSGSLTPVSGSANTYALNLTIPKGDTGLKGDTGNTGATGAQPFQTPPVAWAASTPYTATAPASTVTYQGSSYVCSTSHTSTSTFDAAKFTLLAAKGADGTGTVNGPTTATDSAITLYDGTTGKLLKDSGFTFGTVAQFWSNAANKATTNGVLWSAQAPVAVAYAATVALDFATGLNFNFVPLAGNLTLANPTNLKAGQSGIIKIPQDGTGSRTVSYGSAWKFYGGPPTASTAANAIDGISYFVEDAATPIIRAAYLKASA